MRAQKSENNEENHNVFFLKIRNGTRHKEGNLLCFAYFKHFRKKQYIFLLAPQSYRVESQYIASQNASSFVANFMGHLFISNRHDTHVVNVVVHVVNAVDFCVGNNISDAVKQRD